MRQEGRERTAQMVHVLSIIPESQIQVQFRTNRNRGMPSLLGFPPGPLWSLDQLGTLDFPSPNERTGPQQGLKLVYGTPNPQPLGNPGCDSV